MLELTEMLGTLFLTFFDMYRDTLNFMVLLIIVGFGFSCALTPMLYAEPQTRWDKGTKHLFWTFWAIFGDVGESQDAEKADSRTMFSGLVQPLRYFLYLTLNVLLVNLLIAQMNDSYTTNKEESKRNWGYQCLDAVLEYASDEVHSLPPPFDFPLSVKHIWTHMQSGGVLGDDEDEDGSPSSRGEQPESQRSFGSLSSIRDNLNRKEKQSMKALQHRVINEESGESARKDQDTDAQETMLTRQLSLALNQSSLGLQLEACTKHFDGEMKTLKDQVEKLSKEKAELHDRNKQLETNYKILGQKAMTMYNFIKKEKGDSAVELLSIEGCQVLEETSSASAPQTNPNGAQPGS